MGKQLLQRLARIAVERDCGRFEWGVLGWNVDAQAFYRRMGATVLPDWRVCRVTGDALQTLGSGAATANVRAATRAVADFSRIEG